LGDLQIALRALVRALSRSDTRFFPDGVDAAVLAALAAARDDLVDWFGSADPADWSWGPLHVREFTHPLGGDLSRGPLPAPGGFAVVNRAEPRYLGESGVLPLPWTIADGPDMRFVVSFGDAGPRARIMLPHGSSGDPDSPHYDDQIAPWIAGEYRDTLFDPAAVEAAAVSRLRVW
jgi:penicillin amidase